MKRVFHSRAKKARSFYFFLTLDLSPERCFTLPMTNEDQAQPVRRWYFSAELSNGSTTCLAADGSEIDEDAAKGQPFNGDIQAALAEADRRADRHEKRTRLMVDRVTANSLGLLNQ
jgi:hypothetical protein